MGEFQPLNGMVQDPGVIPKYPQPGHQVGKFGDRMEKTFDSPIFLTCSASTLPEVFIAHLNSSERIRPFLPPTLPSPSRGEG